MMKIDMQGAVPLEKVNTDHRRNDSTSLAQQSEAATAPLTKQTQLSDVGKLAQQTFDTLGSLRDVDLHKVKQIQLAIEQGELQLDEDILLKTILDMHK